jgi:hypothetical protein
MSDEPDPIDLNRTAEALGLTRLDLPPPAALVGPWTPNGVDVWDWPAAPGDATEGV